MKKLFNGLNNILKSIAQILYIASPSCYTSDITYCTNYKLKHMTTHLTMF